MEFDHDRLRVFQLAVDCYEACVRLTVRVPSLHWHLVKQLLRACASVSLNIAEGAAEFSPAEKKRFYRMALRSAAESGAVLTILIRCNAVDAEAAGKLRSSLLSIVGGLTAMITRQPAPRPGRQTPNRAEPKAPEPDGAEPDGAEPEAG